MDYYVILTHGEFWDKNSCWEWSKFFANVSSKDIKLISILLGCVANMCTLALTIVFYHVPHGVGQVTQMFPTVIKFLHF